jgi:DNA-binding transcriptional MerR regulator
MTIGILAARAGVSPDTVRYYERMGLLPPAERADNGYRRYADPSLRRLSLIRNAVEFGFSLKDLSVFLQARDSVSPPCRQVRNRAEELLGEVEERIRMLTATKRHMRNTLRDWDSRLSATPAGAPARLLDTLPPARAATRRPVTRRLGGRP